MGHLSELLLLCEVLCAVLLVIPLLLKKLYYLFVPRPFKDLRGKKVLVTGAAHGLGKGLAIEFAKLGCTVLCVDVNGKGCEQTAMELGGKSEAFTCDVSDRQAVAALAAKTGPVDILINNAGIIAFGPFSEIDNQLICRSFDVNVKAHFWLIQEYLPEMLKRNKGQVVAIASVAGLASPAYLTLYSATKFAVVGLMQALAEELRLEGSKVKTTCVCPYFIRTLKAFDTSLKTRVPPMEVADAVRMIMNGIRKERQLFTVPEHFQGFLAINKLFPKEIQNRLKDVLYVHLQGSATN